MLDLLKPIIVFFSLQKASLSVNCKIAVISRQIINPHVPAVLMTASEMADNI